MANQILLLFIAFIIIGLLVIQYNKETYRHDVLIEELKSRVSPIYPRINDMEVYAGDKSYTINKERIFLCLKDEKGQYYDDNMLTYVFLHEIAHVLNDEVGHGAKFQQIFDQLLKEASSIGIYDPRKELVQNYCP